MASRRHSGQQARSVLCARLRGSLRLIPLDDIHYLQAEEKYVVVHHARGEDLIEESLKSLEEEFASRFIRIHRNCLVARHELVELRRLRRAGAGGAAAWQAAAGSQPPLRGDAEAGTAASVSVRARPAAATAYQQQQQQQQRFHGSVLLRVPGAAGHAKPIHVSSMAPSMAPTVLPPHPGPTSRFSCVGRQRHWCYRRVRSFLRKRI
jgi:hypothetical protein